MCAPTPCHQFLAARACAGSAHALVSTGILLAGAGGTFLAVKSGEPGAGRRILRWTPLALAAGVDVAARHTAGMGPWGRMDSDDDVSFEEMCAGYEAMDQQEYEEFIAATEPPDADGRWVTGFLTNGQPARNRVYPDRGAAYGLFVVREGVKAAPEERFNAAVWPWERGADLLPCVLGEEPPRAASTPEASKLMTSLLLVMAMAARITGGKQIDTSLLQLLSGLARDIVEGERAQADDQTWDRLAQLATRTLTSLEPVPAASFGTDPQVWALTETGLVVDDEAGLRLALPLFEQYFAAHALRSGAVGLEEAAGAPWSTESGEPMHSRIAECASVTGRLRSVSMASGEMRSARTVVPPRGFRAGVAHYTKLRCAGLRNDHSVCAMQG
ncbi:hypothetical protein [Streptomyces mirabilis]